MEIDIDKNNVPEAIINNENNEIEAKNLLSVDDPMFYAKMFFTDRVIEEICFETNRYSVQKNGKYINVTSNELRQFLGIQIFFGIYNIPPTRMA